MAKSFAWKMDLLMKLTGTSNSELGRRLGFDASYISRVRHGKRGLPTNQPFIEPACAFFAKLIRDDYQRKIITEEMGSPWPDKASDAADMLAAWLEPARDGNDVVKRAVDALGAQPRIERGKANLKPHKRTGTAASVRLYYDNAGKRDAVIDFLTALCETESPQTLLLHSNENMAWLYEDDTFARQWASLLIALIGNGGKVRIIHTLTRNASEMWEAVSKWMPLYMTGAVEPYYHPQSRGDELGRTLFVAQGHSAVVASSVSGLGGLNMLIDNAKAVSALEMEFNDYLALCKPLMRVSFPQSAAHLAATVAAFAEGDAEVLASVDRGKLVCAREGIALAANLKSPLVSFAVEEPRMATALWDYLQALPKSEVSQGAEALALLEDVEQSLTV